MKSLSFIYRMCLFKLSGCPLFVVSKYKQNTVNYVRPAIINQFSLESSA